MNELEFELFVILFNELLTFTSGIEPLTVEDNLSTELVGLPLALATNMVNGTEDPFDNLFLPSSNAGNPSTTATFIPYFGPVLPPHMETSTRFTELPPDNISTSPNNDGGLYFLAGQSYTAVQGGELITLDSVEEGARRYAIVCLISNFCQNTSKAQRNHGGQ